MSCYYTLLFHYNNQSYYLAPRKSIIVVEDTDLESVQDSKCANCGSTPADRTWGFIVNFEGGCDLASAWALFNQFMAFWNAACKASADMIVERQVCDEPALVYKVTNVKATMADVINQYLRERVLTMKVTLTLTAWAPTGQGVVLVG